MHVFVVAVVQLVVCALTGIFHIQYACNKNNSNNNDYNSNVPSSK